MAAIGIITKRDKRFNLLLAYFARIDKICGFSLCNQLWRTIH